jgi:hypothetical protein
MKSSYLALFGFLVAYSAYQGTNAEKSSPSQQSSLAASGPASSPSASTEVDTFPTIGAGLCALKLDPGGAPCNNCGGSLCPAEDLLG